MNEGSAWANIIYIGLFDLIVKIKGSFVDEVK